MNNDGIHIILFAVKVLLIQPPIEDFYDTSIRTYPLGLLYLGTRIRDICEVAVLDLRSNRKPRPLAGHPFPELAPYYREDVRTPFSFFGKYYRFGADEGEIKAEIKRADPDVVCISSLFTTYAGAALDVARCAKEVNGAIVTVMGGIHPTLFPLDALGSPWVDYVIRGEGETPLYRLVQALSGGAAGKGRDIEGLCYRDGEGFRVSEPHVEQDIDIVPDRTLLDPAAYRIGKRNYTFFLTSRGCPFHCAFCGRPSTPYRRRTLAGMEREIESCLAQGIGAVDFEDDMLNLDPGFFRETLGLFEGTGITLSAMNGIYTENLDTLTLEKMYGAGFRRLNFSLVDISRPVMDRQARPFPSRFLALLPYLESSPYLTEAHFIIGLPGQTADECLDTLVFLMGRRLLPGPSLFYLAPGSAIFRDVVGEDWTRAAPSMRSSAMRPVGSVLSRDSLFTLMKLTRFINFVKNMADRDQGTQRVGDIAASAASLKDPMDREIVDLLLKEERFVRYDRSAGRLMPEPQDQGLVRRFFEKAKGLTIRGFKTMNSVTVD